MKGYKNSTKTVYETEESDYASGYRSGKDFYPKSRTASSLTPSEKGGSVGKIARGIVRATVIKPTDALVKALSHTGVLTDDDGTKASPAYVKGQLKARKDTVGYAEGGSVKKPRPYDPVKDEPTSRPLTADQVRNIRNRMKAAPPKKRAYDPVLDEPTSRPFAKGGYAKGGRAEPKLSESDANASRYKPPGTAQQVPAEDYDIYMPNGEVWRNVGTMNYGGVSGGLPTKNARGLKERARAYEDGGAKDSASAARTRARNVEGHAALTRKAMKAIKMDDLKAKADAPDASFYDKARYKVAEKTGYAKGGAVKSDMAQDKATVRKAVHKHERNMHPGKPLTKMRNGGKVGC